MLIVVICDLVSEGTNLVLRTGNTSRITIDSTGVVSIPTTTNSTGTNTGALVVTGGVGIGGNLHVGGTISVNDNLAVNGPAFSAVSTATTTIPTDIQTKINFQLEEYDTNNNFASSRFTPTVAGYYQLNATVRLDGTSGTGEMMIVIWKNGSEYKRGTNQRGVQIATDFWSMQVSTTVYANGTGDYFEVYVQHGGGSNRTVTIGSNITWFNGCMLRGA
jgi:hypothetical protein